ncbi:MAG: adenylate/guanylate cyclase domain-containing protein [Cyanobacteria bacterium P01_H01_bin.119]
MSMDIEVQSLNRSQRILAAIMLTDAVGFSAQMSLDEGKTLYLIQRDLELFSTLCAEYEGQVLKSTGDGLLMYFVSAVQAVACGLEMQRRIRSLSGGAISGGAVSGDYLEHRIGLHLGDVLFNQVDVLGNGVNIAARLQNHAEPGGLCISQTIYDVVKARLSLNATYLGPVQLKNIQEPVPAYKVELPDLNLDSAEEETAATANPKVIQAPESVSTSSMPDPLMTVVQTLCRHPEQTRIKKLIFGTCYGAWENDPSVLAGFDMTELVTTLTQRCKTIDQCDAELKRVVASLNRKNHYAAIVTVIVENLACLYPVVESRAEALISEVASSEDSDEDHSVETVYQQVANQLENASNCTRVVKLLYCICYNAWESRTDAIAQLDVQDLVQRLHQLAPTLKDLKYRLAQAIKRLNRQGVYTRVANTILYHCRPLYANEIDAAQLSTPIPKAGELMASTTRVEAAPTPSAISDSTQVYAPHPHSGPHSGAHSAQLESNGAGATATMPAQAKDRSDLFELRLDIMRYTNPLRAKLLLHSCLHGPFGFTPQDWSALRSQTIDDLIRSVFDYCETFDDLESKLDIIAHCLGETDESRQVAGALAQAMKPYYPGVSAVVS